MSKQTLNITIPDGYEIDGFDKVLGEVTLKQKTKTVFERIKTVEDLLADHHLSQQQFDQQNSSRSEDEVAYRLIKLLAQSLNEGWKPNWDNDSEYKYYPYFDMRGSSGFRFGVYAYWGTASCVGSRLCYKTFELAEHAGKHFGEVYKQFTIIN